MCDVVERIQPVKLSVPHSAYSESDTPSWISLPGVLPYSVREVVFFAWQTDAASAYIVFLIKPNERDWTMLVVVLFPQGEPTSKDDVFYDPNDEWEQDISASSASTSSLSRRR